MMRRGSTAFEATFAAPKRIQKGYGDRKPSNMGVFVLGNIIYDIIMTNDDTDGGLKYVVYVQLYLSMMLGGSSHGS